MSDHLCIISLMQCIECLVKSTANMAISSFGSVISANLKSSLVYVCAYKYVQYVCIYIHRYHIVQNVSKVKLWQNHSIHVAIWKRKLWQIDILM